MRTALLLLCCVPGIAAADVYKCTVNGHVAYQDQPCAGESEKVEVKGVPLSGMGSYEYSPEAWQRQADGNSKRHEIESLQRENRRYQEKLDQELSELRAKKPPPANGNIEDAVSKASLESEIASRTAKYQTKMQNNEAKIAALQAELNAAGNTKPGQ